MTTETVVSAIPKLGRHRTRIAPGHPADLAVVGASDMSRVAMVLVAGEVVARDGRPCYRR
jgi:adenine deaminase